MKQLFIKLTLACYDQHEVILSKDLIVWTLDHSVDEFQLASTASKILR
jgi:hypothetical protein